VVAEWVELRTAEIGFLQLPVEGNLFRVREVIREPFVVVVPSAHPLAERQRVRLGELAREPFVFYKGRVRSVALDACRMAGFSPRVVCETGELETVRALVRAGLGIALLPQLAVQEPAAGFRTLRLQGRRLERRLGLIGRRDAKWSAAAQAFVDCMDTVPLTGRPHPHKVLANVVGESRPSRGGSGR
jgi:DNA-binding transcriptional LysR family regulator